VRRFALFVVLVVAILSTPLAAEAQPAGKIPRLAYLSNSSSEMAADSAFMQGLRDLGWVDGRTIVIEARYSAGKSERFHEFVRDLISRGVDIFAVWSPFAVAAAKRATTAIPIVGLSLGDPVAEGFAASLSRPGGNITGVVRYQGLNVKRLELLKETVPTIRRVAVLANPTQGRQTAEAVSDMQPAARSLGLQLEVFNVSAPEELDGAFAEISRRRADALVVVPDGMFWALRVDIVGLAAKARLPAIYWSGHYAEVGGLLSYDTSLSYMARLGATFVDKILRGTKPGDLPIEQPMKFEFVVNMKTAKALGLTIPPSILIRADRVIE